MPCRTVGPLDPARPCFHLPGFHVGHPCLTHSHSSALSGIRLNSSLPRAHVKHHSGNSPLPSCCSSKTGNSQRAKGHRLHLAGVGQSQKVGIGQGAVQISRMIDLTKVRATKDVKPFPFSLLTNKMFHLQAPKENDNPAVLTRGV